MKKTIIFPLIIVVMFFVFQINSNSENLLKSLGGTEDLAEIAKIATKCIEDASKCYGSDHLAKLEKLYAGIKKASKGNKLLDKARGESVKGIAGPWADSWQKNSYGNWCGKGHSSKDSTAIDELDQACKDHDACYSQVKNSKGKGERASQSQLCDPPFVTKAKTLALKSGDEKVKKMAEAAKGAFVFFKIKTILGFEI